MPLLSRNDGLAVVVTAPVAEEIIFRGFLMRGWSQNRFGMALTIPVVAAVFAACHVQYHAPTMLMVFGFGLHWCIGAFLAAAQITQTFKPLLKKRGLRPVDGPDGKLQRIGLMPQHLTVEFKP